VVISHPHPDHFGLASQVGDDVPLFIGEAAAAILREAAFFTPHGQDLRPAGHLVDREALHVGPFTITPYLMDHSAFDSYALLVEAGGRELFYSGDLRAHGRKRGTFERLLNEPPAVDVMLLEGTSLSRADRDPMTEVDVEERCLTLFRETEGMVLACFSAQNVDRYVSMYRAAVRAGRDLVIDLYTASIAAATGRDSIPQASWDRVKVFVPFAQRVRVKQAEAFERVNAIRGSRIYPEELSGHPDRLVMTFRPTMAGELERAGCLDGASGLWSMWPGYLDAPDADGLKEFLARHSIPLSVIHASGHAAVDDLQRLAAALEPDRIVPIHTAAPEAYADLFGHAEPHRDGEWWEV
jgi:ribonuclease J